MTWWQKIIYYITTIGLCLLLGSIYIGIGFIILRIFL